jgi:hypothetical protein
MFKQSTRRKSPALNQCWEAAAMNKNDQVGVGSKAHDAAGASLAQNAFLADVLLTRGKFGAECIGPREDVRAEYIALRDQAYALEARSQSLLSFGRRRTFNRAAEALRSRMRGMEEVKWRDSIKNIVTTVGKNDMEDKYLAGSAYTAVPRMGLKGTGTAVIGDTQASHASWLEQGLANAPTYTGNRPTPSFSAASGGVKSTSAAVSFAITSSGTVFGCFINMNGSATKDDTTGILFSAGDFTGGSKAVTNGDTLNVTYSLTLT